MKQVTAYKVNSLTNLKPDSIVALKVPNQSKFELWVTDLQGVPYSLNIPVPTSSVTSINNTDGNLEVSGSSEIIINVSPSLLSTINSALQESNIVTSQTLVGNIDGVNNLFNILDTITPDSEEIFINGLKIKKPEDYNISGSIITLTFSPQIGENISINYLKQ